MNKNLILKTEFIPNEKISNLTTYKNSGTIVGAFYPKNERQLINIYDFLKSYHFPFVVIGNGSNLLISEKAKIFAICLKKLKRKLSIKKNVLSVSSSATLFQIYQFCLARSFSGFEKLALIPATVGGAIKQNASAFQQSIFDRLESVKIFKYGRVLTVPKSEIKFDYHFSNLDDCLIISAKFALKHEKKCKIKRNFYNCSIKRSKGQPKGFCCGSVFKNPKNNYAGKLIELCGLKGLKRNDAEISKIHANFIINNKNASFEDIKYLINFCEKSVQKKFGIKLQREVQIIE